MKDQHVTILKGLNFPNKYLLTTAWRCIFLVVLWFCFVVPNSALAQSNAPKKLKSEQTGELTRKYSEKKRNRGSRGSLKGKSSAMQKSYYKKKSKESGYPGNIWINPKPKDFTAIKERVERNPGTKNLKAQKSRQAFFQESSSQRQQSFGGDGIVKKNPKLNYRYTSRAMQKGNGSMPSRVASNNYKKSSKQQQRHRGNIVLQPEAMKKDYSEIKNRVERNPGVKNMNAQKSRQAFYQQSSNQQQRSLGGAGVVLKNPKLNYRYTSRTMQKGKGSLPTKVASNNYKKSSKQQQRHSGNIFLQPEAMKKDFNEIKNRGERNPGGNMARQANQQKNRTQANTALTQNYRGDISLKSPNQNRKEYKYDSRVIQKSAGGVRAPSRSLAKLNATNSANFSGDVVLPSKNYKRLRYSYMSKTAQKSSGEIRRQGKGIGPEFSAQFSGNVKGRSSGSMDRSRKYLSKSQSNFGGDYKGRSKGTGPDMTAQFSGNMKGSSAARQRQKGKYLSSTQSQFSGELQTRKYGAPSADQSSLFGGNIRFYSKKRMEHGDQYNSKTIAAYSGDLKAKKVRKRTPQTTVSGYEGDVAVLSKKQQDRFMRRDAKIIANYSGTIKGISEKQRQQEVQAKSLSFSEYSGNIRLKKRDAEGTRQPGMNAAMQQYQGDVIITARQRKKLQYEYLSQTQHNFSGEVNLKKYSRWMDERKSSSNMMANFQGNIKLTQAEIRKSQQQYMSNEAHNFEGNIKLDQAKLRDRQYEHMSKSAHNFEGNVVVPTKAARDRNFRNLSDRNQQFIGGFTARTRLARDIDEQILSARVQNYEGGAKTSWLNRMWLGLFDRGGDKLEKADNRTRKPKYDSREYKIWY